jgi:hypothetical protein
LTAFVNHIVNHIWPASSIVATLASFDSDFASIVERGLRWEHLSSWLTVSCKSLLVGDGLWKSGLRRRIDRLRGANENSSNVVGEADRRAPHEFCSCVTCSACPVAPISA